MNKIIHEVRDNPEKIWLEPGCSPERCWAETRLDDCEEPGCGAKAVAYVREDIVDTLRAVINALGEQLKCMIDNAGKAANLRAKLERLCDAAQAVIRVTDRATIEFDGLKAALASAHTDDKPAHSAFANSENARKGEQRTICEACGNANLAHDRAAWAEDGTSYCPQCRPTEQGETK